MNRQGLALLAFGLGIVAIPFSSAILELGMAPVAAQDLPGTEVELQEEKFPVPNQDLIVVQPAAEDAESVYLELARQKAKLLSRDALQLETQVLRRELVELQATQKLKEVERQLQQIIQEHPNTSAAGRAQMMLQALQAPVPVFRRPGAVPVPDETFETKPGTFERGSQPTPKGGTTFESSDDSPFDSPVSVPSRKTNSVGK